MKLLVIGHSVFDFINDSKSIKESAGGIHYTISALNRLKTDDDEIFLCSQFDDESYKYFKAEYEKINKIYLNKTNRIPRVHLNLFKTSERHEKYENITNNLSLTIRDYNEFDGILINMITGFDITLDQLQNIRMNYTGLIFIDVHTLSRGLDDNYRRNFRTIPNFNEWAKCLDIIQVNELEIFTLSNSKSEQEIIREMFSYGIKILCITKGDKGAEVFYKEDEKIRSHYVKANKVDNTNIVGCGDTFGATFFYNYIRNGNVIDSLNIAVKTAESFVKNEFI